MRIVPTADQNPGVRRLGSPLSSDGHHHQGRLLFFVDPDLLDRGGIQRLGDKDTRILCPRNNVDLFPAQLTNHSLHTRSLDADTSPYRIDSLVPRGNRNFGTVAGLTHDRLDFNDLFTDFRHFELKHLRHKLRVAAGKNDLHVLGGATHLQEQGLHPVSATIGFARDLFLNGKNRFGLAEIDQKVSALHAENNAVHQITLTGRVLLLNSFPLGFAHFLKDHLLGRLGRNPA